MAIIDAHTHMFPAAMRGDPSGVEEEEAAFRLLYGDGRSRMADPSTMLEDMDAAGVAAAVLCPFPWRSLRRCAENNDYLLELSSAHPDRFLALAVTNPRHGRAAVEEARRCLAAGARGLGELHAEPQGFDPGDLEAMAPLAGLAREFDVPLLIHTNEPVGHAYPGKGRVTPGRIYGFVKASPGVKIILPHWGGGMPFYELMPEVAEACADVYYDSAASPFLYRSEVYRLAALAAGAHKILFATDYPLIPYERTLRDAREGLGDGDLARAVLGENAVRLFHL